MSIMYFSGGIIFASAVFQWNSRYALHEMTFQ
jgi:hypothetical protein